MHEPGVKSEAFEGKDRVHEDVSFHFGRKYTTDVIHIQ